MSTTTNQAQFTVPEPTLRTLSFCEPTVSQLSDWVSHLPMANLGESSRQLYHAIIELNQLVIGPEQRFKLNEAVRPAIQQICNGLTKHYLNQPVVLPPKARKVAKLAMALDNHLMVAYKAVVNDRKKLGQSLLSKKPKKITAQAIYNAMKVTSQMIIRANHLYSPSPTKAWHELHQLYLIAESNQILDYVIEDPLNLSVHKTSIADAYKRALMIGCCKNNQIGQRDISNIYDATELWCKNVNIVEGIQQANFTVNLNDDSAPVYSELSGGKNSPFSRGIDLQHLLSLFKEFVATTTDEPIIRGLTVPSTIPKYLLSFLITSWEALTERSVARQPSDKKVQICIGFSATHYFLSGSVDFESQLQSDSIHAHRASQFTSKDIKSINDSSDPWSSAFDAEHDDAKPIDHSAVNISSGRQSQPEETSEPAATTSPYVKYKAQLHDISPNGYCIKWEQNVPQEIKAGEIVGINEREHHLWSIGVIRWVSPEERRVGKEWA